MGMIEKPAYPATDLSRRELLRYGAALNIAGGWSACSASSPLLERTEQAYRHVKQYDNLGWHRTGTSGDRATRNWLQSKIRQIGLEPRLHTLDYTGKTVLSAELKVGEKTTKGLPLFDSTLPETATHYSGIPGGAGAEVEYVTTPPHPSIPGGDKLQEVRGRATAKVIIAVTDATGEDLLPGLTPLNAPSYSHPYGPPILQVSTEVGTLLDHAKQTGTEIEISLETRQMPTDTSNIWVKVKGRQPGLAPLVVLTPTTGWWHCASERGGGIALWLSLLNSARKGLSPRPIIFLATTGHELGHMGLKRFLKDQPTMVEGAHAWLHLGASFCGKHAYTILQGSTEKLATMAKSSLQSHDIQPDKVSLTGPETVGEAKDIVQTGADFLSISGINPWFHNPKDRTPDSIDRKRLQKMIHITDSWLQFLAAP